MRRILVVNNGSLLEEGLEILLSSTEGLDVFNGSFESEEALMKAVSSARPEVIVLSRESSIDPARLLRLVGNIPDLHCLQLLVVSADVNLVDVYEIQQVYEIQRKDFLDLVRGFDVKK